MRIHRGLLLDQWSRRDSDFYQVAATGRGDAAGSPTKQTSGSTGSAWIGRIVDRRGEGYGLARLAYRDRASQWRTVCAVVLVISFANSRRILLTVKRPSRHSRS